MYKPETYFASILNRYWNKQKTVLHLLPPSGQIDLGPMFSSPQILLATGYMGQGLSFGFLAGKCLSELVLKGESKVLPRYFWPERFRYLGS